STEGYLGATGEAIVSRLRCMGASVGVSSLPLIVALATHRALTSKPRPRRNESQRQWRELDLPQPRGTRIGRGLIAGGESQLNCFLTSKETRLVKPVEFCGANSMFRKLPPRFGERGPGEPLRLRAGARRPEMAPQAD